MTAEEIFQIWAPANSPWSRWAKAVAFMCIDRAIIESSGAIDDASDDAAVESADENSLLAPDSLRDVLPVDGQTIAIVDLPGRQSVRMGVALAEVGYQPTPLFNSVVASVVEPSTAGVDVAVPMEAVQRELRAKTDRLAELNLPHDAPPAFLLDSRRRRGRPSAGSYDNRSISLPTDFPSANYLLAAGVRRAAIIIEPERSIENDLQHTLRRWQQAGIEITVLSDMANATAEPIIIPRPPHFRHLWYGLLATFGLKRNPLGGFGGYLPTPSNG